jgi:hypothetical protein
MRQWSAKQYLRGQLDLIDWLEEQDAKDRKTKNRDASGQHAQSAPLQAQKAPRRKARSAPKTRAKTSQQAVTTSSPCSAVPSTSAWRQGPGSKDQGRTFRQVAPVLSNRGR